MTTPTMYINLADNDVLQAGDEIRNRDHPDWIRANGAIHKHEPSFAARRPAHLAAKTTPLVVAGAATHGHVPSPEDEAKILALLEQANKDPYSWVLYPSSPSWVMQVAAPAPMKLRRLAPEELIRADDLRDGVHFVRDGGESLIGSRASVVSFPIHRTIRTFKVEVRDGVPPCVLRFLDVGERVEASDFVVAHGTLGYEQVTGHHVGKLVADGVDGAYGHELWARVHGQDTTAGLQLQAHYCGDLVLLPPAFAFAATAEPVPVAKRPKLREHLLDEVVSGGHFLRTPRGFFELPSAPAATRYIYGTARGLDPAGTFYQLVVPALDGKVIWPGYRQLTYDEEPTPALEDLVEHYDPVERVWFWHKVDRSSVHQYEPQVGTRRYLRKMTPAEERAVVNRELPRRIGIRPLEVDERLRADDLIMTTACFADLDRDFAFCLSPGSPEDVGLNGHDLQARTQAQLANLGIKAPVASSPGYRRCRFAKDPLGRWLFRWLDEGETIAAGDRFTHDADELEASGALGAPDFVSGIVLGAIGRKVPVGATRRFLRVWVPARLDGARCAAESLVPCLPPTERHHMALVELGVEPDGRPALDPTPPVDRIQVQDLSADDL